MAEVRGNDRVRILWIGIATLGIFAVVVLVGWALGLDGSSSPGLEAQRLETVSSFENAIGAGEQDTARVARLGQLDIAVHESSGVAVSRDRPGVLWTHNDGNTSQLHAVHHDGSLVGTVDVTGVDVVDWEDVALGPCPTDGPTDRDCLYLGDIGDNEAVRDAYSIDIIPEPDPGAGSETPALRRVFFRYPDGPADTESLALAPNGDAVLITKGNDGSSRVYRLPLSTSTDAARPREAVLLATLPLDVRDGSDRITGGAVSPAGDRLAVRNHHAVYLFPMTDPGGTPLVCEIGVRQPQGEAVDFLTADRLILTSEEEGGLAPIVRLRCP